VVFRSIEACEAAMASEKSGPFDGASHDALIGTLEGEIVPRLLMVCRSVAPAKSASCGGADVMDAGDVQELARLLLAHGPKVASEFVEVMRQRGIAYDRICVDLLVPAAHRLAEHWERRDLSYPELKVGLDALQSVVAGIGDTAVSNHHFSRGDSSTAMSATAERYE
jgi:MerR family transcriptional regulator, light-induced transcriptional regulator